MDNKKFKVIGDIITLLLLTAAFAMSFYFGFFEDGGMVRLSAKYLSLITVGGMGVLFIVGSTGAYSARKKKNALTPLFVGIFCAQLVAFVGLISVCFSVLYNIFGSSTQSGLLRALYIIFSLVMIAGYAEAVFITEPLFAQSAYEDTDDEDDEDEDEDDEDED